MLGPRDRDQQYGFLTADSDGTAFITLAGDAESIDETLRQLRTGGVEHVYLYEISTAPNMIADAHDREDNYYYFAVGGILWSQVRRFADVDLRREGPEPAAYYWEANEAYDPAWEYYRTSGFHPELSGLDSRNEAWSYWQEEASWTNPRPDFVTRRQELLVFMNGITSDERLRRLLGWQGDFPLIHTDWPGVGIRYNYLDDDADEEGMEMARFPWDAVKIPRHLQRKLKLGRPTGEECRIAIASIALSYWSARAAQGGNRNSKRSLSSRPVNKLDEGQAGSGYCETRPREAICDRNARATAKPGACVELNTLIRKLKGKGAAKPKETPDTAAERPPVSKEAGDCSDFNRLEVRLQLGRGFSGFDGAGTFDKIQIQIGRASFPLADHPASGFDARREIELVKAFGSPIVPVKDVNSFRLYSKKDERTNPDSWELAGLEFFGRCSGTGGRVAKVGKFDDLYAWFNRHGKFSKHPSPAELEGGIGLDDWHWETEDAETKTLAVQPPGQPDACTKFKRLDVRLQLGHGIWGLDGAGTDDDIIIQFAEKNVTLAKAPSRNYDETVRIDLADVFGSDAVAVRDIAAFQVRAVPADGKNAWELKSLTLQGRCSGSAAAAEVVKYQDLNIWIDSLDDEVPRSLDGNLTVSDWHWVRDAYRLAG
ncbi:hypothetical protein CDD83_226 [Cordyceps sp. RAO-2017]|nr:hypothetical protein CDD83_226 [Cordyceps sp. RAO-2017]